MADVKTSDDYDGRRDGPHRDRLNANQKPRFSLLHWRTRYRWSRAEWEAIKRAADAAIELRRLWFAEERTYGTDEPTAETIIAETTPNIIRQCQLLQVVLEVIRHKGCDLSDYVYRRRVEAA